MKKLRHMRSCVQKISRGAPKGVKRLSSTVMLGLFLGGSLILCEIARRVSGKEHGLDKKAFRRELQHLDRGLDRGLKPLWPLWKRYMKMVAPFVAKDYDVIAVDMSDIAKPHAKKMENLDTVRDGSKSTEDNAVLVPGWWTVEIVATTMRHHVLPLFRHVWSTTQSEFKSQNLEILKALRTVVPYISKRTLFVFDRGFEGIDTLWRGFTELGIDWVVRLKRGRKVSLAGSNKWMRIEKLAEAVVRPHLTHVLVSDKNKLTRVGVSYGWVTIQLRKSGKPFTLLTAQFAEGGGGQVMLLTAKRVTRATQAARIVRAYYRRWQVEENIRFDKQMWDIEDVRVLRFHKLQALLMFTVLTAGALALYLAMHPRSALAMARKAPVIDGVPPFPMYRILIAIRIVLSQGGRRAISF